MKVLILDVINNYTVQYIYPNSSNYTESYRSDGAVEVKWVQVVEPDESPGIVSGTFFPDLQEAITVDDSVQVSVGDSALVEPFFDILLAKLKERKIYELKQEWQATMLGGFTVESTGNTYGSQMDDIMYINMQAVDILMFPEDYPDTSTFLWKTENNGIQPHTVSQFKDVCKTLRQHLRGNIEKLWSLEAQVNQATTIDEIKAIKW